MFAMPAVHDDDMMCVSPSLAIPCQVTEQLSPEMASLYTHFFKNRKGRRLCIQKRRVKNRRWELVWTGYHNNTCLVGEMSSVFATRSGEILLFTASLTRII
jgi:hypothetical protein